MYVIYIIHILLYQNGEKVHYVFQKYVSLSYIFLELWIYEHLQELSMFKQMFVNGRLSCVDLIWASSRRP